MKNILTAALLAFSALLHAQELVLDLPYWASQNWEKYSQAMNLRVSMRLNPFIWRGDFNGDGRADLAMFVENSNSKKQGILFMLRGQKPQLIGAGIDFGNGGDDFSWIDFWHVEDRGTSHGNYIGQSVRLQADGLMAAKDASASALIYMRNGKLKWHQYGD